MKRFLKALIIAFGLPQMPVAANAETVPAEDDVAKVIAVQGTVLVRAPWAPAWRPIEKGQVVKRGDMVQVTGASAARLKLLSRQEFAGFAGNDWTLTLDQPGIVRMTKDELKSLKLTFAAPTGKIAAWTTANADEDEDASPILDEFGAAWSGVVQAMNSSGGLGGGATPPDSAPSSGGAELKAKGGMLKIVAPPPETVYESGAGKVKLVWRSPPLKPGKAFKVKLGRVGNGAPKTVGTTAAKSYSLSFLEEGDYVIQVQTSDGEWLSDAQRVHVVKRLGEATKMAMPGHGLGQKSSLVASLEILGTASPKPGLSLATSGAATIDFSAADDVQLVDDETLRLLIFQGKSDRSRAVPMTSKMIRVVLKRGVYRWQMQKVKAQQTVVAQSGVYDLSIRAAPTDGQWLSALSAEMSEFRSAGRRTIYLDTE